MSHDPREAECAERIVAAVIGLIRAVHDEQPKRIFGQIETLLTMIIEHKATLAERPSDEALRRAISRPRPGQAKEAPGELGKDVQPAGA